MFFLRSLWNKRVTNCGQKFNVNQPWIATYRKSTNEKIKKKMRRRKFGTACANWTRTKRKQTPKERRTTKRMKCRLFSLYIVSVGRHRRTYSKLVWRQWCEAIQYLALHFIRVFSPRARFIVVTNWAFVRSRVNARTCAHEPRSMGECRNNWYVAGGGEDNWIMRRWK